jgi:hypothetical protein
MEDESGWDCTTMGNRICGVGNAQGAIPGDWSTTDAGAISCRLARMGHTRAMDGPVQGHLPWCLTVAPVLLRYPEWADTHIPQSADTHFHHPYPPFGGLTPRDRRGRVVVCRKTPADKLNTQARRKLK